MAEWPPGSLTSYTIFHLSSSPHAPTGAIARRTTMRLDPIATLLLVGLVSLASASGTPARRGRSCARAALQGSIGSRSAHASHAVLALEGTNSSSVPASALDNECPMSRNLTKPAAVRRRARLLRCRCPDAAACLAVQQALELCTMYSKSACCSVEVRAPQARSPRPHLERADNWECRRKRRSSRTSRRCTSRTTARSARVVFAPT